MGWDPDGNDVGPTSTLEVESLGVGNAAPGTKGHILANVIAVEGTRTRGATVTTPTVTSGVAFTPSTTYDAMVYPDTGGATKITIGPTTGAEHLIVTGGTDDTYGAIKVPASWKMVLTSGVITRVVVVTD